MSDTSENNNQDTTIDNNENTTNNNIDQNTTNSKINKTMICQEVFNPKTEKGKFKVDCWNVEKNGDITPRDVNKKSRRSCWFTCDVCNHDFQRTIRMIYLRNKWCPFCYDGAVCDNDDCDICYSLSFASLGDLA